MDKKLTLIEHLYGDVEDRAARRALLQDDELAREYEAMEAVKFRLDHRPSQRPDADVLANVFAAAEAGHPPAPSRRDRRPVARGRRRMAGIAGLVSLSAAALLVVAVWWQPWGAEPGRPVSQEPAAYADDVAAPMAAPALRADEALQEQTALYDPSDVADAAGAGPAAAREAARPADFDVLAWDAGDEVRRLRQRIDVLEQQRLRGQWGDALQPAGDPGVVPAPNRLDRGLRQAGERRH